MKKTFKYPFLHELTKAETASLNLLVALGEASKYEISKESERRYKLKLIEKKLSYSAVLRGVNSLHKNKLIEVTKTQPSKKNTQIEVDYYKLSLAGVVKLLLPIYGWRGEPSEEIGDYALETVSNLLKNYPEMYPLEYQEFSDSFKLAIAVGYSIMYVTSEIWEISPFIRAYTENESDVLTYYIKLVRSKLGDFEEYKDDILLNYMTKKDLNVMVRMIERLIELKDESMREIIEKSKSEKEDLKRIKDMLHGVKPAVSLPAPSGRPISSP